MQYLGHEFERCNKRYHSTYMYGESNEVIYLYKSICTICQFICFSSSDERFFISENFEYKPLKLTCNEALIKKMLE